MGNSLFVMPELRQLPAHLIGGNFLLTDTDPELVFTPEDLSPDQRLMAQTAEKVIAINDTHYGRVEDAQMGICHLLCYAFMEHPEWAAS